MSDGRKLTNRQKYLQAKAEAGEAFFATHIFKNAYRGRGKWWNRDCGGFNLPDGYEWMPTGDKFLTRRCIELSKQAGVEIFVKRKRVNLGEANGWPTVGYFFPKNIIQKAEEDASIPTWKALRVVDKKRKRLGRAVDAAMADFIQNPENQPLIKQIEEIEGKMKQLVDEVDELPPGDEWPKFEELKKQWWECFMNIHKRFLARIQTKPYVVVKGGRRIEISEIPSSE